jgi:hypothetical protein
MSTSFETPVRRDGYAAPDGLFASLSRLNAKNVELERINRQLSSQVRQLQIVDFVPDFIERSGDHRQQIEELNIGITGSQPGDVRRSQA